MKKSKKLLCLLFVTLMFLTFSVTAFASNTTNSDAIIIEVATDKAEYKATGVAEITATITNVSGTDINNVTAQAVFNDLSPAGKRTSQTNKSVDVLKSGESFSFTYKATLNKSEHDLNFFQKIILWFIRLFNGGYTASNNSIDVVAENVTDIDFGKYTAENVVQVGYDFIDSGIEDDTNNTEDSDNQRYEELISGVDIDNIYDYDQSDISIDEETGFVYINNIIILMFEEECSEQDRAEIIDSINGKVVGGDILYDELYIEIEKSTLKELENLCDELNNKYDVFAVYETAMTVDSQTLSNLPNDPWIGSDFVDWNVSNGYSTADSNWWILSTETQRAWTYNEYFNNINIGIVDIGFDKTHEDLNINVISQENSYENHGTHVAGIIGATANNKKGISGIVTNKNLYGYSIGASSFDQIKENIFKTDIFKGLKALVENKCKVINFSLGFSGKLKSSDRVFIDKTINIWGEQASREIAKLLENGYDFVVTQSAGNGAPESNGASKYLGVDALQNGLFCSITQDNCYSSKKVSVEQIMNRIIVVANANKLDNNNNYQLSIDSNGGSKVDIAAPGTWIYSTLAGIEDTNNLINSGQKYGQLSGTSMAAPVVAGVAGLVWSVNENFTGAQVKEMVCRTSKDGGILVKDNPSSPTTGSFYLVNAKLAVEEAIKKTYWTGTVKGRIINQNKDVLTGVTLVATNTETDKKITAQNNKDGTFSLLLPSGNYNIVAYKCSTEKLIANNITIGYNEEIDLGDIEVYQGSANVTGKVKDKDTKNPVSNVSILIDDMDSDNDSIVIKTNENGEFETTILQDDDYTFTFSHDDYEIPYDKKVDASTANIDLGDIFLSKDGYSNDDESGESGDTEERTVTASGECGADGDNVTWVLYDDGELVISGSGETKCEFCWYSYITSITNVTIKGNVTSIDSYAFLDCGNLTSIIIPNSVTSIGNRAFYNCTSLTSVTIPDSVTSIDNSAFYNCTSLTSVTIPDSVTSIGEDAFYDCDSLTSVEIPDSVTSIGDAAFDNCDSLTSVEIPDSVTSLGKYAFRNCNSLTNVDISGGVTSIGSETFCDCYSLTSITIPNNVTSIGGHAFYNCDSLTSITVPNSVTSIGYGTFASCNNLTDVYYSGTQEEWEAITIGDYNEDLTNATIHYNS